MQKGIAGILAVLLCIGLMAGCAGNNDMPSSLLLAEIETEIASEPLAVDGGGVVRVADGQEVFLPEHQTLVQAYMDAYYGALAALAINENIDLFAADAIVQQQLNIAVWRYLIGIRATQQETLALIGYQYEIDLRWAEQQEDGSVRATLLENTIQNFKACPQVDSKACNVVHEFVFVETSDGWKIAEHMQEGSLYEIVGGSEEELAALTNAEAKDYFSNRVEELLYDAYKRIEGRKTAVEETSATTPVAENRYDAEAAISYAYAWAAQRNDEWPVYDEYGGNCQNFVSQCLFSGGIPMDIKGEHVWKWYGNEPDNTSYQWGRSATWSDVEDFYEYVKNNSGYGLVAQVKMPYQSGRPGDIIHMGDEEEWTHTVLITEVVKDNEGNVIDYLICSNTADYVDFPVSIYPYARQEVIQVYGWNNP